MAKKKGNLPAVRQSDLPTPVDLGQLSGLEDLDVKITVEWGRAKITVEEALALAEK